MIQTRGLKIFFYDDRENFLDLVILINNQGLAVHKHISMNINLSWVRNEANNQKKAKY